MVSQTVKRRAFREKIWARMDAVRVSPGTARSFEAGSNGLEVLVFGARVEGDAEMVKDFWGDS
jgi:hypothetical protein